MRLWILRPGDDSLPPWIPYYNRVYGFVVRARSEDTARSLAASKCGDEGPDAWLSSRSSTCVELRADGQEEVSMEDSNRTK